MAPRIVCYCTVLAAQEQYQFEKVELKECPEESCGHRWALVDSQWTLKVLVSPVNLHDALEERLQQMSKPGNRVRIQHTREKTLW